MSALFDTDLFVIGAGSGGVRAARIAAGHGARVIIAEEYRVGGTCVIRGCVPKKLLVYAARFHDEFEAAAGFGWTLPKPHFDWSRLIAAKDHEIARLETIYAGNLEKSGVEIVRERARLRDAHHVELASGRIISAKTILIATGAWPVMPNIEGQDLAITSNELLDLPSLPRSIVIYGAGYIAVEFAGVLSSLGVAVTLVYRGTQILRGFDEDIRSNLHDAYVERGIRILTQTTLTKLEKTSDGVAAVLSSGEVLRTDQVMMALGRAPYVADLGLERAGVVMGQNNRIVVDAFSRTNIPSVYAVGDVTDRVCLTPIAIREGHAFADTVFGQKPTSVDHGLIPTAVFSTPEIGTVGLTQEEAAQKYDAVDVFKTQFRPMKAVLAAQQNPTARQERIMMKLLVDVASERVVGVHILGDNAGEMVQFLGILLKMGAKKSDFDATIAVHPSAAEELVTLRTPSYRVGRSLVL